MERVLFGSLRAMEAVFPPALLGRLLWPMAAFWSAWELAYRGPTLRMFRRLPPALRPAVRPALWLARVWRHRCWLILTKLLGVWPDRIQEARWQRRYRLIGFEQFEKLWGAGRPVVLAGLHFGTIGVFYDWLRARGLPAAALVGPNYRGPLTYYRRLRQRADRVQGLEGIPRTFEVGQLYEAVEFLRRPGVLLILVDGGQGRHLNVTEEGYGLLLSPGAFRLAALSGAAVLPFSAYAEPGMRLAVHIGQPVPDDLVVDRRRHEAAGAWLLRSYAQALREHPEQCSTELLFCFRPPTC